VTSRLRPPSPYDGEVNAFVTRPSVLRAALAPKPWGWEKWLTATRPEAPALVEGTGSALAERIAAHPEVLGPWTRRLFGDTMPIFAKVIHTHFPSHVHVGFRRKVERGQFLLWLEEEQALLRRLLGALRVANELAFVEYQARYAAWATQQALSGWRIEDDEATTALLESFVDPTFDLPAWLRLVRGNRAALVDTLNEIDLKKETGNLFLTGAGVIHAIFGLSHQTHPTDRAAPAYRQLFALLARESAAGTSDEELTRAIQEAGLAELSAKNAAPPKNEAWFPALVDGAEVLVEPQQTSDTTYSLADFYTPLTWSGEEVRFRKGAPRSGLSREELVRYLEDVEFEVAPVASFRRVPQLLPGLSQRGAALSRLLDEPRSWPFFTVYQVDLTGSTTLLPPLGVFQELVVTRGRVGLSDERGDLGELGSSASGFIPATLEGSYRLTADEPATVLILGAPGARGSAPRLASLSPPGAAR
jgi:hypothetical protein